MDITRKECEQIAANELEKNPSWHIESRLNGQSSNNSAFFYYICLIIKLK